MLGFGFFDEEDIRRSKFMMIVFDGFKTTHEKMQTQIFEQFSVLHQAIMREGERRR